MPPTTCVYLSNLAYEATPDNVTNAFLAEKIAPVRVELLLKGAPTRQQHSGLAVVHLATEADTARSCAAVDGKRLLGRPMVVRKDRFEEDPVWWDDAVEEAMDA
ncbi:MAG: hypothetical protein J3K34DRAFT_446943 [Monoraphidium minutum]|nr:MAG: hypothetical protein J3K34DRAFT_446943 [Monoraphidium minutum]